MHQDTTRHMDYSSSNVTWGDLPTIDCGSRELAKVLSQGEPLVVWLLPGLHHAAIAAGRKFVQVPFKNGRSEKGKKTGMAGAWST